MSTPNNAPHHIKNLPVIGVGARTLITVAATFIVMFGLKYTQELGRPIVLAAFLAIISYPITEALRRLRFPHWLAVGVTVLVDLGIIFGIYRIIRFLAADMKSALQGDIVQQVQAKFNSIMALLDRWGVGDQARELLESPLSFINPQQIISLSQFLTGQMVSFLAITTLVLILMTFMLGEAPLFIRNLRGIPSSLKGKGQLITAVRGIQRYLFIKTLASVSTGLLTWWLCHAQDIPCAFLWGFVACVLNYIPTIGSIAAAVPPILLALLLREWSTIFIVAFGYLAINCGIGNGIEPLFLGRQFGIATTVVLLSVLTWGWVWGPVGMLLAVPITLLIKLALEHSPDLHWVATFIDDRPPSDKTN